MMPIPLIARSQPAASRGSRLDRGEWLRVSSMALFVLALHVAGFGLLIGVVAPHRYSLGTSGAFTVGLGITAYVLGMRHAFDADHIAAIDNTTRKLMAGRRRPVSVGFWFSLGHSSVVFVLCLLLGIGLHRLAGQVTDGSSQLHSLTGLIGTLVSGFFLMLIAVLNLGALRGILGVLGKLRSGRFKESELERHLDNRGLMNRILKGATRAIDAPWKMYPLGVLFGLGFDTATEVSLLVLAGGAAAFQLPWYAILTLPVLFAAGMSLLDTIDGCFMNFAYGWAFASPVRKIYYNLTITALSIAVALIIGMIELLGLLADKLGVHSGPLGAIGGLDLNTVGYGIVAMFVVTWLVALAVWKFGRIEERWSANLPPGSVLGELDSSSA